MSLDLYTVSLALAADYFNELAKGEPITRVPSISAFETCADVLGMVHRNPGTLGAVSLPAGLDFHDEWRVSDIIRAKPRRYIDTEVTAAPVSIVLGYRAQLPEFKVTLNELAAARRENLRDKLTTPPESVSDLASLFGALSAIAGQRRSEAVRLSRHEW